LVATLSSLDAETGSSTSKSARSRFASIRRQELFYTRALRGLAKQIGNFILELWNSGQANIIEQLLTKYSDTIEPWAVAVSNRMIAEVNLLDEKAWMKHAGRMSRAMQAELSTMPQGEIIQYLRNEQVNLIKSLPLDAAKRVQNLSFEAVTVTSQRANEIAKLIANTENVEISKATLIARTEIARSHAIINEGRARWIGSEGYIWRTLRDRQVRQDHQELEGLYFTWNDPPVANKKYNVKAHPGAIYNCRCYAEPVLPARFNIKNVQR
jgi:SPP1 gp7 family putative phage head morphogenesis protein